jgi:hypothetical protein
MKSVLCASALASLLILTAGISSAQETRGTARAFRVSADDLVGAQESAGSARTQVEQGADPQLPQDPEPDLPQNPEPQLLQDPEPQSNGGLLVFFDCHPMICDMDYLRRQITFINYVRDRKDAQIHVLATARQSGSGWEITFDFIGLREFEGDDVTHIYMASNTDIADETREGVAQVIRVGVLHYLVRTPLIKQVEIRQEVKQIEERFLVVDPTYDPWNFWVFRFGLNGALSGEDRRSNRHADVNISANRTTEEWKLRINGNLRYDDRKFILNDGSESFALTRQISLTHQTVKSLGEHWGASVKAAVLQATFVNQDLTWGVLPGIEYNFFPYAESSRRSFTITYELGVVHYDYIEETIFGETSEWLYDHGLQTDFAAVQPWGEAEFSVETAQFLSDPSQWRLVLNGRLEFRIVRGLSFNVRGHWATIRDQRYLPAAGQTDEEILLEQQALATDSRHSISFGFSYTFGSIFNNVVNPRFTGSRDDFSRFF